MRKNKISVWVANRKENKKEAKKEILKPKYPFQVQFVFPNIWQNRISRNFRIVIAFVPIDAENTKLYLRSYQKMARIPIISFFFGRIGMLGNRVILNQNKTVVITQQPIKTSLKMDEKLVHGVKPIIIYRQRRQELINSI